MANVTRYKTTKGETRYRVRYRKPDGTQTDKRGFRRKIDAENWAAEHVTIAKATNSYIDPQAGKATVEALWPSWIAAKKVKCKVSYIDSLEVLLTVLQVLLQFCFSLFRPPLAQTFPAAVPYRNRSS